MRGGSRGRLEQQRGHLLQDQGRLVEQEQEQELR